MKIRTAYILSGGKSRRMGRDKLFLLIGTQTLLSRTISTCQSKFSTVKLAAPPDAKFDSLGLDLIPDFEGCQGPLAGIIASLADCGERFCFITAADFPGLDSALIDKLIAKLSDQQYVGVSEPGGIQPLCGIYATSALPFLREAAENGVRKVSEAISALQCEFVGVDESLWHNINSPADLEKYRKLYGQN